MRLFHRTTSRNARAILKEGFRDSDRYIGSYADGRPCTLRGLWLADRPAGEQEVGPEGVVLSVDLPDSLLEPYEVVEGGMPYREWCVPAALVNQGRVLLVADLG